MKLKHNANMEGPMQVRQVKLSGDQMARLRSVSDKTGLNMSDLHRMAINRFLEHVADTGRLPIPDLKGVENEG